MKISIIKILLSIFILIVSNIAVGTTLETSAGYKYPAAATFINTKLNRIYFVQCYEKTSSSLVCAFNESSIYHTEQTNDTCSISSLDLKHIFNYDTQAHIWIAQDRLNPCGKHPIFYLKFDKSRNIWNYIAKYIRTGTKNFSACNNRKKYPHIFSTNLTWINLVLIKL